MILSRRIALRVAILAFCLCVGLRAQMPAAVSAPAAEVRFCALHHVKIAYLERGRGRTLILIHGMFGDYLDWEPVLDLLSRDYRVIALDLPGFGASEKPDREYTGEFFIETLDEFLHRLKVKRATLVGNSFGGQVALLYALCHPERIEQLVLVDSDGFRLYTEQEKALTRQRFSEQAIAALTPQIHRVLFAPIFASPSEMERRYLEKQDAKLQRRDYPAYAKALARSIELSVSTYVLEDLPRIHMTTLLLWGGKDRVVPVELAERALAQLPRGQLRVLAACGHVPQLDCPQEFNQAVEQFLRQKPH